VGSDIMRLVSEAASFVGGMNVPSVFGRANATIPLARLVIDGTSVSLRPRGIGRGLMTDFIVDLSEIEAAFKLSGLVMTSGVGLRLRSGVNAYFWTFSQQDAVLAALAAKGVHIEQGSHPATGLWSLRTPDSGAILPRFPALLQALTPMLALISTAILIVVFVVAQHWWMRAFVVLVWAFSMVTTLGMWRRGRDASRQSPG